MLDLKNSKVKWDTYSYIPKKVYGFESKPMKGTAKEIALEFLKENKDSLKISARLSDLRYEKTTESLGASTSLFQQYFNGRPIHGAWVAVHVNKQKRVFMLKNETVPVSSLKKKLSRLKAHPSPSPKVTSVIKKKIKECGGLSTDINQESMIYAYKNFVKYAWKVKFGTKKPAASWILFIDNNGNIIEERNILRKISGKGRVFIPNPVVALDRDDIFDRNDADQETFKKAYKTVELMDLQPGGYLKGPYVDTGNTPNRIKSSNLEFLYSRKDDGFEEVMAYYHIDSVQRYIQSLGFKDILNRPMKVNTHGTPKDNSYYDPSPGRQDLTFGDGGVDDAEDADVILHEYGHAIQDAIIPSWGQKHEGAAMGEGFGDYLAASFFSRFKKGERKLRFAEWDVKKFRNRNADCLRSLDSDKRYPEGMAGDVHDDGEIWSACLWKVRKLLGRKKADTVILESHFYLSQYCDFKDGAEAIIMAEKNLYGGKRAKGLTRIFKDRGIL